MFHAWTMCILDELRDRMAAYLSHHRVCVISTTGAAACPEPFDELRTALVEGDVWAIPVRYRSRGLEVECLVPRWADVAYHLEQDPGACPERCPEPVEGPSRRVLLVVQACYAAGLRWLQVQGIARPVVAPDWRGLLPGWSSAVPPDDVYLVVHVTPRRIDLFDESLDRGMRETLEIGD
ncbi:MAG: hypothetical protein ACE5LU_20605 [Anaerolineae bacterium]